MRWIWMDGEKIAKQNTKLLPPLHFWIPAPSTEGPMCRADRDGEEVDCRREDWDMEEGHVYTRRR